MTAQAALDKILKLEDQAAKILVDLHDTITAYACELACEMSKRYPKRTVTFEAGMGSWDYRISTKLPILNHYYSMDDGWQDYFPHAGKLPEAVALMEVYQRNFDEFTMYIACDKTSYKNGEKVTS